jgi:hypothetical protein
VGKRRNDYDVTDSVKTTDPDAVAAEVRRIYLSWYEKPGADSLIQPFDNFAALYRGEHPDYHACDTGYHDMQHVLDVTLAMTRLLDGYQRVGRQPLDERLFRLGIVLALYHDVGYLRNRKDTRHKQGAEYTLTHVSRGGLYLRNYLPRIGMADLAAIAARLVHYTGFEVPVDKIRLPPDPIFRVIGNLLGTADILGQMSDRCYLEKCHERLYPEFVAGGVAVRDNGSGEKQVVFESGADLVLKTPGFYQHAEHRLDNVLGAVHRYAEKHFEGNNLYVEAVENTVNYARTLTKTEDMARLRRLAPEASEVPATEPVKPKSD